MKTCTGLTCKLEITLNTIKDSIVLAPKLKIGAGSITLNANKARLRIHVDMEEGENGKGGSYSRLKLLKRSIAGIQVKGLAKVDRGVIVKDDAEKVLAANGGLPVNRLLVTGYGLKEVMGTDGTSIPCLCGWRKGLTCRAKMLRSCDLKSDTNNHTWLIYRCGRSENKVQPRNGDRRRARHRSRPTDHLQRNPTHNAVARYEYRPAARHDSR